MRESVKDPITVLYGFTDINSFSLSVSLKMSLLHIPGAAATVS